METKHINAVELLQSMAQEKPLQKQPAPQQSLERPTIHWTELPESVPGSPAAEAWDFYRQEVGRLLAEGQARRWALIKGRQILGVWSTEQEANQVRLHRFPTQDVLVKQVLEREPILRAGGYFRRWRSQPSLVVMDLVPGFPFDVLIGLDVLLTCKTLVDGPAQQFAIEF